MIDMNKAEPEAATTIPSTRSFLLSASTAPCGNNAFIYLLFFSCFCGKNAFLVTLAALCIPILVSHEYVPMNPYKKTVSESPFIIHSDHYARTSGQITSNFLTQASWRLHEEVGGFTQGSQRLYTTYLLV